MTNRPSQYPFEIRVQPNHLQHEICMFHTTRRLGEIIGVRKFPERNGPFRPKPAHLTKAEHRRRRHRVRQHRRQLRRIRARRIVRQAYVAIGLAWLVAQVCSLSRTAWGHRLRRQSLARFLRELPGMPWSLAQTSRAAARLRPYVPSSAAVRRYTGVTSVATFGCYLWAHRLRLSTLTRTLRAIPGMARLVSVSRTGRQWLNRHRPHVGVRSALRRHMPAAQATPPQYMQLVSALLDLEGVHAVTISEYDVHVHVGIAFIQYWLHIRAQVIACIAHYVGATPIATQLNELIDIEPPAEVGRSLREFESAGGHRNGNPPWVSVAQYLELV